MSGENEKRRKPIWVNWVVVTLLLVTTRFTLIACATTKLGGESTKPTSQSPKPAAQATKQEQKNQPTKSAKQKDVPLDKIEETTVDDDPE